MKIKSFILAFLCAAALSAASVWVDTDPCLVVKGQNCEILWSVSGMTAAKVNISILQGSTVVQQFLDVPNASGDNSKIWPVPASLAPGSYKFRVATVGPLVAQGECVKEIRDKGIYTDPNTPSGTLIMGNSVTITFKAFGIYPGVQPAYFDLYRSGTLVGLAAANQMSSTLNFCGMPVEWPVGQLVDADGEPLAEKAPAGSGYKIRIRNSSGDYWAETGTFTIARRFNPGEIRDLSKGLTHIPVWPVPGCPQCGEVQLEDLWKILEGDPDVQEIQLWHGNRMLAKLVERGAVARRLAGRRVEFGDSFARLRQGGAGFELRLLAAGGRLLGTQAVAMDYKSK